MQMGCSCKLLAVLHIQLHQMVKYQDLHLIIMCLQVHFKMLFTSIMQKVIWLLTINLNSSLGLNR